MSIILYLLYAVLTLAALKLGVQLVLSLVYNLRRRKRQPRPSTPKFSIIVPAYNEEKTIRACVESLQNLNYWDYEVIVVDDGSVDRTYQEACKCVGVTVIHQSNKGKPNALNTGIRASTGEIILTVDADTELDGDALESLAHRFALDERLGAVAGNVKVKDCPGLLNLVQSAEYVSGINLVRKGQSVLGCVTIVPGPIASIRREVVEKVGFFSDDTFAEDFDITLKTLNLGYRIEYEEKSIAYTDAPKNVEDLVKQRRRWYRGMVQVLDKHRDMYFNAKLGLVGIFGVPNLWLDTVSSFLNVGLLLVTLLTWLVTREIEVSLLSLVLFLMVYLGVGIAAIFMEPKVEKRNFLALPLLLFYNMFLDGIRIMSLTEEMVSIVMEWEKPKR